MSHPPTLDYRTPAARPPFDHRPVLVLAWAARIACAVQVFAALLDPRSLPLSDAARWADAFMFTFIVGGLAVAALGALAVIAALVGTGASARGRRPGPRYWRYACEAGLSSGLGVVACYVGLERLLSA